MYAINGLYPQYKRSADRRQQNIPVAIDRRSGKDRRSEDRVMLDKQLTKDIFEVKSKVAKLESLSPKLFESNVVKQAPSFSETNNMTKDILVRRNMPDSTELARRELRMQKAEMLKFQIGLIATALAAAAVLTSLTGAGAVIALGTGAYIGGRILKLIITRELSDNKDKNVK